MSDTKVTCRNNGPLIVEGSFTLHDQGGSTFDLAGRTVIGLCRCGLSDNKPFCDGSHNRKGFTSEIKARALEPPKAK